MKIAIFGSNSLIAKNLISKMLSHDKYELKLFSRDATSLKQWLETHRFKSGFSLHNYTEFNDPLQIQAMGNSILDITFKFDHMVLEYLAKHPECKYIFLSSGAVYGSQFVQPATACTPATIEINNLSEQSWYGIAKLYSECRHRALSHLNIFDIRIFNYVNRFQNLSTRFLITDILRSIHDDEIFQTGPENIVRDYLHPEDFYNLIKSLLSVNACNTAVDCFTKSPISKRDLLEAMTKEFGLRYEITTSAKGILATGSKPNYYSLNHKASEFGYIPKYTSLESILKEAKVILTRK
jgi:nucleoside-diphosphate-sugar epimerase